MRDALDYARRCADNENATIRDLCNMLTAAQWDLAWGRNSELYGRLSASIEAWVYHSRQQEYAAESRAAVLRARQARMDLLGG